VAFVGAAESACSRLARAVFSEKPRLRSPANTTYVGVGLLELSGVTSQRGLGVRDLSGVRHGAGQQELIGIAPLGAYEIVGDTRVGVVVFVDDTRVGPGTRVGAAELVGDTRAAEFAGHTHAGEFVSDTRAAEFAGHTHAGEFVGDTHAGAGLGEFAGIGCGTVRRIGDD